MLAFAAPDQENAAIFLKRVSYDHRDPHIHENVRRQDRVAETARAERILSLRFGLKEWNRMREVGFVGGDENKLSHTGLARGVDRLRFPLRSTAATVSEPPRRAEFAVVMRTSIPLHAAGSESGS